MGKKLIGIAVIVIMLFGIFGLTACDNMNLSDYKTTKNQALQAYADAKCEANNYCTEGLAAISAAVTDGKAEIDKATSAVGVDTAYKKATDAIDEVAEEDAEVKIQIRKDYLERLDDSSLGLDDIYIFKFFGVYNDSYAVIMAVHGLEPPSSIDEITVEGFEFSFNTGRHISIWKDGEFFSLQAAYDEYLLTLENIEAIYNLYNS